MSKKHFIALADCIRQNGTFDEDQIKALADFCERQNPRFNADRWIRYIHGECGPCGGTVKAAAKG